MFPQFKSFEALQTVKSSIVSLCMIFKSIFEDSKASYLIEIKGLPIALVQVLRISQLYLTSCIELTAFIMIALDIPRKHSHSVI